ncbi:MAG: DUF4364 family protein [Clostridia bacterium]|nr:DUF4364 family protein [Clostridia bacterium]
MPSSVRNLNNVKIFVLYLMRNINYPMSFATVNDIVRQNDYVMYLDFAEAFHAMLDGGLIKEDGRDELDTPLYSVTRKGAIVADELHRDISPAILDQSLRCALRYLDFAQRGVVVDSTAERQSDGTFNVTLTLKEKDKILLSTTVNADSEYRSHQLRQTFRDRPDVIYRGILALLAGKVDFLFDK